MDRLFLDANVLFSAAYRPAAGLLRLWKENVVLCSSRYALEEARVNLEEIEARSRLDKLAKAVHWFEAVERHLPKAASLPEKDIPILLATIDASATHLLTGDIRHFGALFEKKIAGITVMLPGEYLRRRR